MDENLIKDYKSSWFHLVNPVTILPFRKRIMGKRVAGKKAMKERPKSSFLKLRNKKFLI